MYFEIKSSEKDYKIQGIEALKYTTVNPNLQRI